MNLMILFIRYCVKFQRYIDKLDRYDSCFDRVYSLGKKIDNNIFKVNKVKNV